MDYNQILKFVKVLFKSKIVLSAKKFGGLFNKRGL